MRSGLRLEWYFFCCEDVCHTFSDCRLSQFDPRREVTIFLLTQVGMRSRMPLAFTQLHQLGVHS
jgi:hypothetical protein